MNLPTLADQLLPFLLPLLRQSAQSGGASAQVAQHELSGGLHVGVLADSQAPQFLKMDGSRELTGNLSVIDGVQIDGVDISAHAGDPAAHHAPVTAGTLISVLGQQVSVAPGTAYQFIGTGNDTIPEWRNVSELAGNGLTATNGVLAVGVSGLGLSVTADAVALASSSNPGAAASILATDASGYLQLVRIGLGMAPTKPLSVSGDAGISGNVAAGSLSVTGAATVGGDFTVGSNVLYVNQSGTRVGINRAPDQQFDLDVAGAIRGQYLVGKHAIQLSSAVGVWHYDGPAPYNLDFGGSNASHAGVGGTESGGVIYRPGKFGKAVQVAEATTNYCYDPSSEGTTGWTAQYNGSGYLSGAQSTDYALYGAKSYKITATQATWTTAYNAPHYQAGSWGPTWAQGESVTVSCYVRGTGTWRLCIEDNGENLRANQPVTLTNEWQRVVITTINSVNYTYSYATLSVFSESAGTIYIDGVQIEKKAYATPYCDGSLGTGHSWSGTAHASSSSRVDGELFYSFPTIAYDHPSTIMGWFNLDGTTPHNLGYLWYIASDRYSAYCDAASLVVGTVSCGPPPTGWFHVALATAGNNTVKAFVNGVLVGTASISRDNLTFGWVGGQASAYQFDGLVDEFVILDWQADDKLIRAIYESDAPVFVESSVFHWRSPSRVPIWVDEFGLWARGVSGNEILGLYGGDPRNPSGGVTKSWGGVTMEENDVVIGRTAQAAVHWDDSAGTLLIGRSSAANILLSGGALRLRDGTTDKIVLDGSGNASFTGSITSSSGTIGGWTIGSTLSATNLILTPGAANTANILAGTGSTAGGINSAASSSDIVFWSGASHAGRGTAAFRVTAGGALTATNATITGTITASSGSITGALTIGTSGEIRQGTGTLGSDFTGLRILQASSIGQVAVYDANVKTMRISSDDVRYKMASAFTDIRTIKWLEDTDYTGTWSDLSSANGNYAYVGAYYTSTNSYLYLSNRVNNTGSPANTRHSQINLIASRNESGTVYSKGLQLVTFNSTYNYDGIAFLSMALQMSPVATPTYGLNSSDDAQVYLKGGYIVFRYNDGGTYRYKYLNLSGTSTSWVHTTTPP